MPITPLHFGPALLARAAFGPRFGLLGFLVSQVLLDVEPGLKLFGLAEEGAGLHEWHSWALAPAFVLAAWAVAMGLQWGMRGVGQRLVFVEQRWRWLRSSSWSEAVGATFGVVSHLLLDALYHTDVATNVLLPGASGLIPQSALDLSLLVLLPISAAIPWHKARHNTGYINSISLK